jgi:hypothetical protein
MTGSNDRCDINDARQPCFWRESKARHGAIFIWNAANDDVAVGD